MSASATPREICSLIDITALRPKSIKQLEHFVFVLHDAIDQTAVDRLRRQKHLALHGFFGHVGAAHVANETREHLVHFIYAPLQILLLRFADRLSRKPRALEFAGLHQDYS